ncbi:R3H domain-containing protein [Phlyctema vagabunda]|uniref:R3H domain-containing protein n=1 Tax=Phlyctema vagabunda TaxID=108571 RepID=A0ABR4PNE5_9HELO
MATAPMSADTARMSFAKVAASGGKENLPVNPFNKASTGAGEARNGVADKNDNSQSSSGLPNLMTKAAQTNTPVQKKSVDEANTSDAKLVNAVKALSFHNTMPSLVVNGSGRHDNENRKSEATEADSEDLSQRADSGSDLGTKPPSLDGKSITSGTTFALDEKESLRPDDSASVKAAEDDDAFSGRGSIVAGSRMGSEAAGRAYRAQFYDVTDRRNMLPMQEHSQGAVTPQSGSSGQQIAEESKNKPLALASTSGAPDTFNLFYRQTPDEKLLEALESPKDRIFLLRLEQQVIEFVKDSKEPFIDLPPCNSFCRMLTHKLADYYHMTHQVEAVAGAVRIFRTPFCRLPPSLTSVSNPPTSGSTPPPTVPAMKIMRRGGDGDTGANVSKANSETGSDGKPKSMSAKEKLSREEREAVYNKARERIFGKEDKTGDATPETEDGNEMSRSSSVSARDKSVQPRRGKQGKQRRDDSDSFDSRSQYLAFYPPQQQPAAWAPQQYSTMGPQPYPQTTQNYINPMPPQYASANQQFNPGMVSNGNAQQYNNMGQFPQPSQQRFQHQSTPNTAFGSPTQAPQAIPQQWVAPQNLYQNSYPQRTGVSGPQTINYPFGQLPSNGNPADPKSQHPIPGSFNRHAFNPKTQSFVPGSTGAPAQQPMSHHGSPHLPYNAYATPPPPPPQFSSNQQFGNGMGYSMARQGSNNSVPSYHASPHMAHRPMMHQTMASGMPNMPHGMPPPMPQGISQHMPQGLPQGMPSNGQLGSHLPNFGNSSTLPPKPPPAV